MKKNLIRAAVVVAIILVFCLPGGSLVLLLNKATILRLLR